MKEDYLWNKTGQDFEIERLENALQVFRYKETEPPALPAKIIPFEKKNWWSFFRLSFASAVFATLMIACLGVWLQFSPRNIEVAENSVETVASQIGKKDLDANLVEKPSDLIVEKVEAPKQSFKQNIVKARKVVPTKVRRNNLIARNVVAKKPAVILTKEEKYAYDQLMLALSITSSKLKLVSDKVSGGEE